MTPSDLRYGTVLGLRLFREPGEPPDVVVMVCGPVREGDRYGFPPSYPVAILRDETPPTTLFRPKGPFTRVFVNELHGWDVLDVPA